MTESIRVGVITEPTGAHLELYFSALAQSQGVEQVAVADSSGQTFEKAKQILGKRFQSVRTFRNNQEMLREINPHMALVTLEAHHSPEPIKMALEQGCHVLAEKPACVNIQDFQQLVEIAESGKRHLMLALANRIAPPVKKAKELVESGFFGKLFGADLYMVADQKRLTKPEYHRSWFASKEKAGGGFLIWLGIHWLDLIQLISGDHIQQVCGFARNVGGQPIPVEDAAVLAFSFERGMVGTLNSGYYLDRGYQSHIMLWGSLGWLRLNLIEDSPLEWYSTRDGAPQGIQSFSYTPNTKDYAPFVQASIDCVRGKEAAPITGSEGLHVLKVIMAFYRAAQEGRTQIVS